MEIYGGPFCHAQVMFSLFQVFNYYLPFYFTFKSLKRDTKGNTS